MQDGVETLDMDIDDLFKDEELSQAQETSTETGEKPEEQMSEKVTKRINKVKADTERETRDKVAKELGYENYAAMQKEKRDQTIRDNGYNPEDINKLIDEAISKDPRIIKLAEYEERDKQAYIDNQLTEINKATGQNLKMEDLSQDVLDLWSKGIDLEKAYYAINGKQIITTKASKAENGSLTHLASAGGARHSKVRALTEAEKDMYRAIVPGITEEELAKKTIKI